MAKPEPQVASPHRVDSGSCSRRRQTIHQADGTCTNGGWRICVLPPVFWAGVNSPDVRLIVVLPPAGFSWTLVEEGIIQLLVEAGAALVTPGWAPVWAPTTVCLPIMKQ